MKRYSFSSIFTEAFRDNLGWEKAWAKSQPKKEYDIKIVGGGGHGLATAFYLAKKHKITYCSLDEIISRSDIITIHLSLNEKTNSLISKNYLQKTKEGLIIINTSRGEIIDEDALIRGTFNGIRGSNSTGLYISNDGSISTSQTRAINLLGSTNAEIINNTSGIISSETGNTIAASSGTISGATVTNSGLIYATSGTAITFGSTSSGTTLTNNSGARIYNGSSDETIRLGASSTLINSGTIENTGSPTSDAIDMKGNGNTVTFKDKGLVILSE